MSEELDVDHDTKRVLGSPNIVEVIARKIREASVFVADVTLTGLTHKPDGDLKLQINSNVATELGFALGTHGDGVVLKLMNEHYGEPKELPFDVRDRHPILFKLAPGATKSEWKQTRDNLKNQLIPILRGYYENWQSHPSRQPAPFEPASSTIHEGAYWESRELLVDEIGIHLGREPAKISFADDQASIYFRLSPQEKIEPLKLSQLPSLPNIAPFMLGYGSFSQERNRFGNIWFSVTTFSITQLFESGEVWGVSPWDFKSDDDDPYICLPSRWFEEEFAKSVRQYSNFARDSLGYHHVRVVAGLVNFGGRCVLGLPNDRWLPASPRRFHKDVKTESDLNLTKETEISAFLERFFRDVFDKAGVERQ